ncbi:Uncharacterised protein [BD1-7 clade bacterium]|uniref:VOC domain-containing protein n=1 Tax=BD1-7 clade bacterium TaxID=2029982 RepID=A0A5S9QU71_9GAMM|nr:Uncharacterised protein [BD1-7 clade bacterium]CAA0121930.1 Uncharacterised protein [BD1-7 clade bacterium]
MSLIMTTGESLTDVPAKLHFTLSSVCIYSRRWQSALAFYRDVIGLPIRWIDECTQRVAFALGTSELILEAVCNCDTESFMGYSTGIAIETDDFKQTYNDLIARDVEFVGLPTEQPGQPEYDVGGKVQAEFYDLDGNILMLVGHKALSVSTSV